MSALRDQILEALLQRQDGAGLAEVAAAVGRPPPLVHHHLSALVQDGMVTRDETRGRPRYRASPYFSAVWVAPEAGRLVRWTIQGAISWRYPLTSRIGDAAARETVLRFLREAEAEGLLQNPIHLGSHLRRKRVRKIGGGSAEKALALRFAVFGSVARGEASPSSDVDLLALPGPSLDIAEELKDVAAETNLASPRRLDLLVARPDAKPNPRLAEAVRREGFVVYSLFEGGEADPLFPEVPA